jgi:hypothetical protein
MCIDDDWWRFIRTNTHCIATVAWACCPASFAGLDTTHARTGPRLQLKSAAMITQQTEQSTLCITYTQKGAGDTFHVVLCSVRLLFAKWITNYRFINFTLYRDMSSVMHKLPMSKYAWVYGPEGKNCAAAAMDPSFAIFREFPKLSIMHSGDGFRLFTWHVETIFVNILYVLATLSDTFCSRGSSRIDRSINWCANQRWCYSAIIYDGSDNAHKSPHAYAISRT